MSSRIFAGIVMAASIVVAGCGGGNDAEDKSKKIAADVPECPLSFYDLREEAEPFQCKLEPGCTQAGGLFGSNPYAVTGGVCSAAVQTGLLTDSPIVLELQFSESDGEEMSGADSNGVKSASYKPDAGTRLVTISVAD